MTHLFKSSVLALVLSACGGEVGELFPAEDAGPELGQTAQALTRVGSHGIEADCANGEEDPGECDESGTDAQSGAKCIVPWQYGACSLPLEKVRRMQFYASTCSSWWQARFVEVQTELDWLHGNFGWAWTGPAANGYKHGTVRCGVPQGFVNALGGAWFTLSSVQTEVPGYGTITQKEGSEVRINTVKIEAITGWGSKTETQRKRFARNVIKHELYHTFGIGHGTNPGTGALMYPYPDDTYYYSDLQLTTEETNSLHSYQP